MVDDKSILQPLYTYLPKTLHIPAQDTTHTCPRHYTYLPKTLYTYLPKTLHIPAQDTTHTCPRHYTYLPKTLHIPAQDTTHTCPRHYTYLPNPATQCTAIYFSGDSSKAVATRESQFSIISLLGGAPSTICRS